LRNVINSFEEVTEWDSDPFLKMISE
jgi:hypothetical protein